MKNGDHPVSNFCPSLIVASKKLLTTVHTFFPFFDCYVSTSFKNPIWIVEIRRMTWIYVQNMKAAVLIHQMRHTILWDSLLKNIVITSQLAMMYQFQKYAKRCTDVVIVKKILPGYLHGSYRSSTRALVARIDHNVEEFDCRHCNCQDQYKMRSDDFSPYKLIRSHRCSEFCLPSSAHSLKNKNKLSTILK